MTLSIFYKTVKHTHREHEYNAACARLSISMIKFQMTNDSSVTGEIVLGIREAVNKKIIFR